MYNYDDDGAYFIGGLGVVGAFLLHGGDALEGPCLPSKRMHFFGSQSFFDIG